MLLASGMLADPLNDARGDVRRPSPHRAGLDVIFRAGVDDHAVCAEQAGHTRVKQQLISFSIERVVERDRERRPSQCVVGKAQRLDSGNLAATR
jgi:hypothetical protein